MRARYAGAIILGLVSFFFARSHAHALEPCPLVPGIKDLAALHAAPPPDELEALRKELVARRALLGTILDCALAEAHASRASIASLRTSDPEVLALEHALRAKLDNLINYYALERSRVSDFGLHGSREAARALKERRLADHLPLLEHIKNFLLWSKNHDLIRTADLRLKHIESTLAALKLDYHPEVAPLIAGARDAFRNAQTAHRDAQNALHELRSPQETLDRIRDSLESLSRTYHTFLGLSTAVNSIIPR